MRTNDQRVFPSPKTASSRFTRIDNDLAQNKAISYRARGIMTYVFSKPLDWCHSADSLSHASIEGVHAIRAALRELAGAGYATLQRVRGEKGTVIHRWVFREAPSIEKQHTVPPSTGLPNAVKPSLGKPPSGLPSLGKPALSETTVSETTESIAPAAAVAPGPAAPRIRQRDEAFEALVRIQGADLKTITDSERGAINKALKSIRAVAPDVTAALIGAAAQRWRRKYPTTPCTAPTIAKHWSELTVGLTPETAMVSDDERRRSRVEIANLQRELAAIRGLAPCLEVEAMEARKASITEIETKLARLT